MVSKRRASIYPNVCSSNVRARGRRLIGKARSRLSRETGCRLTAVVAAALLCAGVMLPLEARAHPAGFTSVNRYVGLECNESGIIHIAYLLDFAEMPSYSELDSLDANHDGTLTPA